MKQLTEQQALRYSRHIMLPSMDLSGQEALLNAHVLIIGVGGLGCAVAQYLVAAGIGQITLVDDDTVENSNLQRQVLHTELSVGENKAISAQQRLAALNSECQINTITQRLTENELLSLVSSGGPYKPVSVIVDCSDNLATRKQLNGISVVTQRPLVTGAAIRMEGQIVTYIPTSDHATESPCYACYSRLFGEQDLSCMEAGVLAPIVGIVGATQALEVTKLISNVADVTPGRLLLLDGATLQWKTLVIKRYDQCSVCGN